MAEHVPTVEDRKQVEAMAGYGIPQEDIARRVGIDPKTLRKHYRRELDTGATKANAKVAESLYQNATQGNVTAQIWWTKSRMGWSETKKTELTGGGGEALFPNDPIERLNLTELRQLAAIMARVGDDGEGESGDSEAEPS
jgi:hypothetical protein